MEAAGQIEHDGQGATQPDEAGLAARSDRLGDVLGHHELLRVVGSGACGLVYEAFDPRTGRQVAIKTIRLDALAPQGAEDLESRLRADALAAARLEHPNLVAVHDCERHGPAFSVAMEFVDGETLGQHLARVGKLPAFQALALVAQLLSALELAQQQGLVHGRIDPDHLFISRTGRLKLAGFGVPHLAELSRAMVTDPAGAAYRAPELARGLPADARSDLYSAAAVALHLLTGVLPSRARAGTTHLLPPEVDAVFARALAQDPAARYRTAGEFSAALRTAFEPPVWERPERPAAPVLAAEQPDPTPVTGAEAAPAAPVLVPQPSQSGRPRARAQSRNRFAVAGAYLLATAVVAGLVVVGESGLPLAWRTAPRTVPVAVAPTGPATASDTATALPPAAPPVVITEAAEPAPTPAAVAPPPPESIAAAPTLQAVAPVPARREPEAAWPPLRSSGQLASDTRVAGAGPARSHAVSARRQAALLERQAPRGGPEAACRQQQLAITREVCKVAQCATAEFRGHPVCVRMHAEQRWRDQVAEQAARTR